jgi:excisionase family DNA binding protein
MSDTAIFLTAAQVASLTGFAEGTIRHFVSQRRIPFIRISSRCIRFRRSDIETWLEKMLVLAADVQLKGGVSPCKAREKSKAA